MNITVLGASGGEAPGLSLTGFRIDQSILLDAGTIGKRLTIEEQLEIKHVLITHAHLDHIHALPFLLDNVIGRVQEPVKVYGPAPILDVIKEHLFNNQIWPDFTVLPTRQQPVLQFCPIESNEPFEVEGYQVRAIPVDHSFMATAYIISDKDRSIVFTGDTGIVDDLWQKVKSLEKLKAVFMECSFPAGMQEMARMTKHLCTSDIVSELDKAAINNQVNIYLYHLKPAYTVQIIAEAKETERYQVEVVQPGDELQF